VRGAPAGNTIKPVELGAGPGGVAGGKCTVSSDVGVAARVEPPVAGLDRRCERCRNARVRSLPGTGNAAPRHGIRSGRTKRYRRGRRTVTRSGAGHSLQSGGWGDDQHRDSGGDLDRSETCGGAGHGELLGGGGEQIDLLSGNLNFTLPLVRPQGRGGTGVTLALNYNSQNWWKDGRVGGDQLFM
jgi:hypothetical protein